MTFAWYGHLKFTDRPLWLVIVASWGIAFVEYCFAVPANRWGHAIYSAAELKTMQEVITLSVFAAFSVLYLGERITLNHLVGFALICAAPSSYSRDRCRVDLARGRWNNQVTCNPRVHRNAEVHSW